MWAERTSMSRCAPATRAISKMILIAIRAASLRWPERRSSSWGVSSVSVMSTQQEACAERVVSAKHKLMMAGQIRAAFHLGDHGVVLADPRLAHDPSPELRPYDALMREGISPGKPSRFVEKSETRGGPAAARRAVYLAIRKDRDVTLSQRPSSLLFGEEYRTVDVPQARLKGVQDFMRVVDRVFYLASQANEARQVGRFQAEAHLLRGHASIESAAERDVRGYRAHARFDRQALRIHERWHVPEADRFHASVLDGCNGFEPPRGDVDGDVGLGLGHVYQPALQRPDSQGYRAVTAGCAVTRIVEEHDAEVRVPVIGFDYEAAVHVGVAARFVDDKRSYVI